jgi:hypothetical protein
MSEPKELNVITAFGKTTDSAIILAGQPDELEQEFSAERALVVKIRNGNCEIIDTISYPIVNSWLSNSARAYCTSNEGYILTYFDGSWDREKVSDKEDFFDGIWGISGDSDQQDAVFVTSDESLYIRQEEIWCEYPMPQQVERVTRLHGLAPDEIYICTDDGILCWNGKEIIEVEGPEDDPVGIIVLSKNDMIVAGYDGLYQWTTKSGWKTLNSPAEEPTAATLSFMDDVFFGTTDGVVRLRGEKLKLVCELFCNQLVSIGDAVIASGPDEAYLFDQKKWHRLQLPKLGYEEEAS